MFDTISTIDVTYVATVVTIYAALDNFTLALSFVVFNIFIVVVGVVVGVEKSFLIAVTVAVVAFAIDLAIVIFVVDVVLIVGRVEV